MVGTNAAAPAIRSLGAAASTRNGYGAQVWGGCSTPTRFIPPPVQAGTFSELLVKTWKFPAKGAFCSFCGEFLCLDFAMQSSRFRTVKLPSARIFCRLVNDPSLFYHTEAPRSILPTGLTLDGAAEYLERGKNCCGKTQTIFSGITKPRNSAGQLSIQPNPAAATAQLRCEKTYFTGFSTDSGSFGFGEKEKHKAVFSAIFG